MKIAFYIEDGLEQVVLTPESDIEKAILGKLREGEGREMTICRGSFYECNGGWMRQKLPPETSIYNSGFRRLDDDSSTIIVLRPKAAEAQDGQQ